MMEVYHYTSKGGLNAILSSGYIEESMKSATDAFHGQGVYVTTMSPKEGRKRIADNNWGGGLGPVREGDGNVERAIRLWIPQNKLIKAQSRDRDILVHKGRIYLKDYEYEVERLDQVGDGDGGGGGWFKLITGAAAVVGVICVLILGKK